MIEVPVRFKKLSKLTVIPEYQKHGDSGCDLVSTEDITIPVGKIRLIGTGLSLQMGVGVEGQVRPRSGLAVKHGITVINSPGTIDSGYIGEVKVGLINLGDVPFTIKIGDRIAQLVFTPVYKAQFIEVDKLSDSERGANGFGHTGTNIKEEVIDEER